MESSLFIKACAVINSCQTQAQLESARSYTNLYINKIRSYGDVSIMRMIEIEHDNNSKIKALISFIKEKSYQVKQ